MTLIEVLVALAIFATASLSVMSAVTQHTRTLDYLQEKTLAAIVADNQMALAQLQGNVASARSGQVEMAGRTWYWKLSPTATLSGYIRSFDISVGLDKGVKDPLVTVKSYAAK
jgi:general secretion pathway protein I